MSQIFCFTTAQRNHSREFAVFKEVDTVFKVALISYKFTAEIFQESIRWNY